jgi:tRNA-dihydrouridine synthase C
VNRHGGGAMLLQYPERLFAIVQAVRRSVPKHLPVSAKMRLGYLDDSMAEECALALEAGGVDELVIHARTKVDGYRPPAYWERIADIRSVVRIPMIANGEIWSVEDAIRCRQLSGCQSLMVGRGMVTYPSLALAIQSEKPLLINLQEEWERLIPLVQLFWSIVITHLEKRQQTGRLKQWFNFLRRRYPGAETAYQLLRTIDNPQDVEPWINQLC